MSWWGYLIIALAAYLACALLVYAVYCVWLQHGKRGIMFATGVVLLNLLTFRAVKAWKSITGKRLWLEKHEKWD